MNNLSPTVHFSFSSLVLCAANVFHEVSLFFYCLYFFASQFEAQHYNGGAGEGKPHGMLGVA